MAIIGQYTFSLYAPDDVCDERNSQRFKSLNQTWKLIKSPQFVACIPDGLHQAIHPGIPASQQSNMEIDQISTICLFSLYLAIG